MFDFQFVGSKISLTIIGYVYLISLLRLARLSAAMYSLIILFYERPFHLVFMLVLVSLLALLSAKIYDFVSLISS